MTRCAIVQSLCNSLCKGGVSPWSEGPGATPARAGFCAKRSAKVSAIAQTSHVDTPEIGQLGGDTFHAVYEDVVPLGREYFFVFNVAGKRRLVRTSSVIEITESDT